MLNSSPFFLDPIGDENVISENVKTIVKASFTCYMAFLKVKKIVIASFTCYMAFLKVKKIVIASFTCYMAFLKVNLLSVSFNLYVVFLDF